MFGWSVMGRTATPVIDLASRQHGAEGNALRIALAVWFVGIVLAILLRRLKVPRAMGHRTAIAALAILAVYWGVLAIAHPAAFSNAGAIADDIATSRGEP